MKEKSLMNLSWIFFLAILFWCCQGSIVTSTIEELTTIIDLNTLNPEVNVLFNFGNNTFSIDENDNLYFLDMNNHRILKFDKNGGFITQIGSIGQGEKDLFSPIAFTIEDEILYVLNTAGREIKKFSLNGDFISGFKIENTWGSESLCVHADQILVSVKYRDSKNYNSEKLISLFNKEGKKIGSMGKIIENRSHVGYKNYNAIYFKAIDDKIFGAFQNFPIIFSYDINGITHFYKNLRKSEINEINHVYEKGKSAGVDTPETERPDYSIKTIEYCSGFDVDKDKQLYYAVNVFNSSNPDLNTSIILCFDVEGTLFNKIIPKSHGDSVIIRQIYISSKNIRYCIGSVNRDTFLFKF